MTLVDGRRIAARDGLILGRVTGCDVVIDDSKCSRRHARIVMEGSVVEVVDLDSSNGTLLNGRPVTRRLLRDGDQIQIGATVVVYREGPLGEQGGGTASAPAAVARPVVPTRPVVAAADDDVDLFGDEPATAPSAPANAPVVLPPPPVAAARPTAPPPRPAEVVEFADEVVHVRAPAPAARPPSVVSSSSIGEPKIENKQRILQFAKTAADQGVLGDDLEQMSGGLRALVYAAVLVGAGGLAWLAMTLMR